MWQAFADRRVMASDAAIAWNALCPISAPLIYDQLLESFNHNRVSLPQRGRHSSLPLNEIIEVRILSHNTLGFFLFQYLLTTIMYIYLYAYI